MYCETCCKYFLLIKSKWIDNVEKALSPSIIELRAQPWSLQIAFSSKAGS